ncbi:MAG: hypothetical protein WAL56_02230 [Candidatus Sulfotelmatobacter sp.]
MKKIGIVGGVAWRSTVDYYSEICTRKPARFSLSPEISIESVDLNKAISSLVNSSD